MSDRIAPDLPVTDAEAAAEVIGAEDTVLVSGFGGVGYPKATLPAFAAQDEDAALTVVSGGGVGREVDDVLIEADKLARRYPFQTQEASREAINSREVAFHDRHISRVGDEVRLGEFGDPDVAIIEAVSVGEDWLVPSTSIGHTPSFVAAADQLIVEINHAQPDELERVHDVFQRDLPPGRDPIPVTGATERVADARVDFDPEKLVAVVETEQADDPYEFRDPNEVDLTIADNLGDFLENEIERNPMLAESVYLQFGVGSLGNALMGELSGIDFGNRDVVYFGEVFQDGLLDALDSGLLSGASATSLALSAEGQERLFDGIDRYAEDVVLRPADVSNNAALIERFGVVGVNSAVDVDLYGNANATHIGGTDVVSGIGGGGDFNRNCRLGIIALPSTAAGGGISRIVPQVPHVDHTEHDHSVIVTEHGVADLRGLSPDERMDALIEVADPAFREDLRAYRDRATAKAGHVPFDAGTAFDWQETGGD
ncbi:acetyl-CoA hydrolase/transferase C-terminal domain-containing protein [Halolamina salifodinae]|uniref:Succinyl-CoA:acetate CoA-transferase n=1 Tax=Halolamina salifodinae TaxID=1202767 RepID=A0A8T4GWQ0_9EURY|nr:acetyl-CoA hydrolase/transferase C-terminal domain-containing protein [Halolamina salifodinae]MBP1986493.1 succinyl-CoA:acetate CoA-transferase [Halolamina salifodinae]